MGPHDATDEANENEKNSEQQSAHAAYPLSEKAHDAPTPQLCPAILGESLGCKCRAGRARPLRPRGVHVPSSWESAARASLTI
jgi:hypothetical protein